jgi:hypothetical protein
MCAADSSETYISLKVSFLIGTFIIYIYAFIYVLYNMYALCICLFTYLMNLFHIYIYFFDYITLYMHQNIHFYKGPCY